MRLRIAKATASLSSSPCARQTIIVVFLQQLKVLQDGQRPGSIASRRGLCAHGEQALALQQRVGRAPP